MSGNLYTTIVIKKRLRLELPLMHITILIKKRLRIRIATHAYNYYCYKEKI